MRIAITGHRPNKLNNEYDMVGPCSNFLFKSLRNQVDLLKPTLMISGLALGADQIWASIAVGCKIPLLACIPFLGQESIWPYKSQVLYNKILSYEKCNKIIVCDGAYAAWKMQKRDEYMVDNSDLIIAVFDGSKSGTKNCVDYAVKQNKKIIYINPKDYLKNV